MVLKVNTAVAVLMLLVALFFTGIAVLGIVMLKRVRGCRWGLESDIMCPWGLDWNIQEQLGRARQMEGFSANGPERRRAGVGGCRGRCACVLVGSQEGKARATGW